MPASITWSQSVTYPSNTVARISITATLNLYNDGPNKVASVNNHSTSKSGHWGNASKNVYHNKPYLDSPNVSHTLWSETHDVTRPIGASTYVTFYASSAYSGNQSVSSSQNVWFLPQPTVPQAPSNVSGTPDQATRTSLRYQFSGNGDGGSAITRWEAQYSKNSNFSGTAPIITSSGTSVISGLDPRTTYYFRSRGVNSVGNGSWSSTTSRATLDYPDAPALALDVATSSSLQVKSFDPAYTGGDITSREMQLSTVPTFASTVGSGTLLINSFSGLSRATTYYARARVANTFGFGPWSPVLEVRTLATLPSAPSSYAASDIASTTAFITLPTVTDNGGAPLSDLRVQVNTSASATGATTVTVGAFRSVFLQGLTPGTLYYARLAVQNSGAGGGWGEYGPWLSFTTRSDVPTPPQNFDVTVVSNTTAYVEWEQPADLLGSTLLGYQLRVASNAAFSEGLRTLTFPPSTVLAPLDGLLEGTRYYAQVRAQSTNGPGSYTDIASFLTTGVAPNPQAQWLRVGASWKPGLLWLRVAGTWRQGVLWEKVNDVWHGPGGTP